MIREAAVGERERRFSGGEGRSGGGGGDGG